MKLSLLFSIFWLSRSEAFGLFPSRTSENTKLYSSNGMTDNNMKPTLVVGATGQVGRRVVQQLVDAGKPVRALVRNYDKARELFGANDNIKIVVCDLGEVAKTGKDMGVLSEAVGGCDSIISVSGCMRFSKLTDFLPWRLFQADVSGWADAGHPYFANYLAQCHLIDAAEKNEIQRFVRLTGLSAGFSPFNPFSMIFSTLLSLTSRYHFLLEQYLRNSKVPYVILRPGGLANEDRNPETTNLQADASGSLPPPGRVPRTDVAALAVAACVADNKLSANSSYTLAIRAVGDIKPKPQGVKEDGFPTAEACLASVQNQADTMDKSIASKPYGAAVGLLVYSLLAIGIKLGSVILGALMGLIMNK